MIVWSIRDRVGRRSIWINCRTSFAFTPPPLKNHKRKYDQIIFFHSLTTLVNLYLNYLCITQTDSLFEPDISGSGADNAVNYSNYSSWSWPFNPRTSAYIDALLIFHHVFGQQSDGANGGSRNGSNQSTINHGNFNHRRNAPQISRDLNKQKGYNAWIWFTD